MLAHARCVRRATWDQTRLLQWRPSEFTPPPQQPLQPPQALPELTVTQSFGSRAAGYSLFSSLRQMAQFPEPQAKVPAWPSGTSEVQSKAAAVRKSFQRPKFWVTGFGWCLAACAGAANTIAFKCWSLYASHVTGNTSRMAFHAEGFHQNENDFETILQASSLVLSFLLGAYACGMLIDKNQVHFLGKAFYGLALVLNSALLASAAFFPGQLAPACMVAAACGLQNAMCTSHFGAIIRTTHVTGPHVLTKDTLRMPETQ